MTDLALKVLSPVGYRVTIFASSKSALEHFQQHPNDYDLIITDMTMPDTTGDVLTHRIHLLRPEIPVIFCTGFSEAIYSEKTKMMNIAELLYKPVMQRDLLQVIIKASKRETVCNQ